MSALDLLKRDIDPDEEGSVVPEIAEQGDVFTEEETKEVSKGRAAVHPSASTEQAPNPVETPTAAAVCEDVFCDTLTVDQADLSAPPPPKKGPSAEAGKKPLSAAGGA